MHALPRHGCVCVCMNRACIFTGRVFIQPGSVNFDVGRFDSGWLVYTELVATAKLYVRETSMVPVYALLLFGGEQPDPMLVLMTMYDFRHVMNILSP